MTKPTRQSLAVFAIVVFLVLSAYIVRFISYQPLHIYRPIAYMGLFAVWGLSLRYRIIHLQVRRFFTVIAGLIIFWIFIRLIKYHIYTLPIHAYRYLWYAFYIPMLFLPVFALYIAISVGKPEGEKLTKGAWSIFGVSALLLIMVLSNDYHQKVFYFAFGVESHFNKYSYRVGYFIICIWCLILAVGAIGMILYKSRVPGSRRLVLYPAVPMVLLLAYGICYSMNIKFVMYYFGDMTMVFCLLIAMTLESLLQTGLLQTNSHYFELFSISTVKACITDREFRTLLSSDAKMSYSEEVMKSTEVRPKIFASGIRLSSAPVRVGHVVWAEDLSESFDILEQLAFVNSELEEKNTLARLEYKERKNGQRILEKNRIYNKMQLETRAKLNELERLLDAFEKSDTVDRGLLMRIGLLGVYLKRRNNLLFEAETENLLSPRELDTTIADSLDCFSEAGIHCLRKVTLTHDMTLRDMIHLFDVYEEIAEAICEDCESIVVDIFEENDRYMLEVFAYGFFKDVQIRDVNALQEDENEWLFSFALLKSGVA